MSQRQDDFSALKEIFPHKRDFFHINGKFAFDMSDTPDNEWALGEETRKKLTDAGFRWFIGSNQTLWVYDRKGA